MLLQEVSVVVGGVASGSEGPGRKSVQMRPGRQEPWNPPMAEQGRGSVWGCADFIRKTLPSPGVF